MIHEREPMSKKEKLKAALKKNKEVKVSAKLQEQVEAELDQKEPADATSVIEANTRSGPAV